MNVIGKRVPVILTDFTSETLCGLSRRLILLYQFFGWVCFRTLSLSVLGFCTTIILPGIEWESQLECFFSWLRILRLVTLGMK